MISPQLLLYYMKILLYFKIKCAVYFRATSEMPRFEPHQSQEKPRPESCTDLFIYICFTLKWSKMTQKLMYELILLDLCCTVDVVRKTSQRRITHRKEALAATSARSTKYLINTE